MSFVLYKALHLLGSALLFTAIGGAVMLAMTDAAQSSPKARKLVAATHGIALLVLLAAGFGALAKIGGTAGAGAGIPLWVWLKLAIWLVLGASLVFVRKSPRLAVWYWWLLPLLGGCAGYLALVKPT